MAGQPQPTSFLGADIRVMTTMGEEFEGELFCYDVTGANSLVLRQVLENGNCNYKWVKSNVIREVKALGPPKPIDVVLPAIDLKKIEERAVAMEREAWKVSKSRGVGVSDQAREVFQAINKTMECEWDKEDIIVFGVRISKPYTPDSCTCGDDPAALERVKKVLQGELDRIKKGKTAGKLGEADVERVD
eukprot:TRINITY_DN63639_c0_g1_i1.p2 TRINITY_DN63639_c0_g1~~TRINITY_DN63639_c0_g1_i1.p2  ORF type:complete len:189 (+),score=50.46 TRINITY_DN63639_c0_g1_i1:48-614(+)